MEELTKTYIYKMIYREMPEREQVFQSLEYEMEG